MIRLLKLQKAVYLLIAGVLAYIAYKITDAYHVDGARYLQMLAGILVMAGALWMLYPILFAKSDSDGKAEIITDPAVDVPAEEQKPESH